MNKKETINTIITEMLKHFDIQPQIEITEDSEGIVQVNIQGDNLNYLIGYRGQSLDALQSLITHIFYKRTNEWPVVLVDINDYNAQRIERLHSIAKKSIDRVRFFQNEVALPFMNPWERRQVHTLVSEYDDVESESKGEGKNRRIYLKPKK
ncbi:hypothetical protein A2415_04000 [candidate division WWE3 bacterium RIFOXYC1_FULL_39_7]|uniref:R3H domain-containing protein n=2 Tax=Katanobacteria TaxID=422282 RepID=A0A1F4X5T0_UNCKA|nr:MAG: hypothetical protein A2415_04000 [candidate division WWE3 bacterium RIFOXYC1_FULL_39_7]OGC77027.1 MAG: hypothetical protein A2619_03610 [candidate division WWE3 bacterium RIFOXYD1_FULL_39_9]